MRAKSLVQNGRGFAQGNPQFFVQDGRQRQGFRTHLRGGRSQGVGGLAGITTLDSFATFRAVADLDMKTRSEEHTSELQSLTNLVCRLLLEKKKQKINNYMI